jgi:hypothetical protein
VRFVGLPVDIATLEGRVPHDGLLDGNEYF